MTFINLGFLKAMCTLVISLAITQCFAFPRLKGKVFSICLLKQKQNPSYHVHV